MNGFPPKELDFSNKDSFLKDISIRSGDTLIVEENKEQPKILENPAIKSDELIPEGKRKLVRKYEH